MKRLSIGAVLSCLFLVGCSKQEVAVESEQPAPAPEMVDAGAAAPQPAPSAGLGSALDSVAADIQANNLDAAAAKLAMFKQMPMTPEEQQKFNQYNNDLNTLLLQRAQSDPKAQEAYQNYGRMMLGR